MCVMDKQVVTVARKRGELKGTAWSKQCPRALTAALISSMPCFYERLC